MLVLRVETEAGYGPYSAMGNRVGDAAARYGCGIYGERYSKYLRCHPSPSRDALIKAWYRELPGSIRCDYIYGFKNIYQFGRWFPRSKWCEFKEDDNKWNLVLYETDDYQVGLTQVMFRKKTANKLGVYISL